METFNTEQAKAAQKDYCKRTSSPHFAPYDGRCYDCHMDIYTPVLRINRFPTGISVESAGAGVITGCPHCSHSYCD